LGLAFVMFVLAGTMMGICWCLNLLCAWLRIQEERFWGPAREDLPPS